MALPNNYKGLFAKTTPVINRKNHYTKQQKFLFFSQSKINIENISSQYALNQYILLQNYFI